MESRPGGAHDPSDRAGPTRSGLGSRRVVWGAFGLSAVLHLVAILLYPLMFEEMAPGSTRFFPTVADPPSGLEVIRLVDIEPTPEPEQPEDPDEIEEMAEPQAEAEAPALDLPGIEIVPLGPSVAERLRPRLGDARLWRTLPPEFHELTLEQREELVVADRLRAWYDSVQAGQAAADALTDWTFTDSDGGRWGISPGRIHLGDVTLPLPLNFGTPVGKRDENAELVWQWEEIMRQAARAETEMTWRERAEAIRQRRDAERAQQPDTTRGR